MTKVKNTLDRLFWTLFLGVFTLVTVVTLAAFTSGVVRGFTGDYGWSWRTFDEVTRELFGGISSFMIVLIIIAALVAVLMLLLKLTKSKKDRTLPIILLVIGVFVLGQYIDFPSITIASLFIISLIAVTIISAVVALMFKAALTSSFAIQRKTSTK